MTTRFGDYANERERERAFVELRICDGGGGRNTCEWRKGGRKGIGEVCKYWHFPPFIDRPPKEVMYNVRRILVFLDPFPLPLGTVTLTQPIYWGQK